MSNALLRFRVVALRVSIMLALLMLAVQNGSYAASGSPLRSKKWKVAVVYHVVHGQKFYRGCVSHPVIPAGWTTNLLGQRRADTPSAPPDCDYEIWLERDGGTLGVWVSSKSQRAGCIDKDGTYLPSHTDDAWVKRIISDARSENKNYNLLVNPHLVRISINLYNSPAPSLDDLVRDSDMIVIGLNVGLMRMQHTPVGNRGSSQHSVFLLSIEQYLKRGNSSISGYSMPPIIKIWQDSGILPWEEYGHRGIGEVNRQAPLLNVGDRYLVFLTAFDAAPMDTPHAGYISATENGVTGMQAELDEYYPGPYVCVYSLEHGKVQGYGEHMPFESGSQLVGVSEQDAVKSIKEILKRPSREDMIREELIKEHDLKAKENRKREESMKHPLLKPVPLSTP